MELIQRLSLIFCLTIAFIIVNPVTAGNIAVFTGYDFNGKPCSGNTGAYGPFDYRQRSILKKELKIVEDYHFTREVESLIRGSTNTLPYSDLAYTLRAWPNHHRALHAIGRYNLRVKRHKKRIPIAAECWFQRAIGFSPKDPTTYMLFAMYLHNSKKYKESEMNYEIALKMKPGDIQTHYNLGLLLVDMEQFDRAKNHAQIVYDQNFPLPGLKNKLAAAGYWP